MESKLHDVKGRVDYISSPKRQENLYAVFSNVEDSYWELLAEQNQRDFAKSGTEGTCIEARELIIMLPPGLIDYEHEILLKYMTSKFLEKYDVGCCAALHHNKSKTNLHIHLIFSEREIRQEVERKIASRNMADYELDSDQTQTFIYACLAGVAVNGLLKQAGIKFGVKFTNGLIKKIPGKVLTKINQKVGFRFITKFGTKGIVNLGKLLPGVGAIVGGGLDLVETKIIAERAYKWFFEGDFSVKDGSEEDVIEMDDIED